MPSGIDGTWSSGWATNFYKPPILRSHINSLHPNGTWTHGQPLLQNLPPDLPLIEPRVWDTKAPSVARPHSPVQVFLNNPSQVITQTQYTLPTESRQGLKPAVSRVLKAGLLQPICSPHNTPILAVKKGPHSWRLVQDLRKISEAIIPVHPVVTNPYSLPSFRPPDILYFTDLDLKDAFFTIPLHHSSQPLFAFT